MTMGEQGREKWYFRTGTLVVAFFCIGPLMLPLVWINPRFSVRFRVLASIVIIAASYFLGLVLLGSFKSIFDYYQLAFAPYQV
jgi:small-conductance mechanosensitive channel